MIETVRGFNRIVTQRVGALQNSYLARDRTLAESRVLWEIGERGCEVRTLRSRLDLDSGYLSRLLRSLEASGLVTVGASQGDKRIRRAQLTEAGRRERALLDDRSDELARSMVTPLSADQRDRLVTAMAQVQKLLTASMVEIEVQDPDHAHARFCMSEYFSELDSRFESGFDPDGSLPADPDEMRPPAGLFLVATLHGEPVGCGALKFHGDGPVELKRMWVSPNCAWSRGGTTSARATGAPDRRARQPRDPPRDERSASRGGGDVPLEWLPRGRRFQRGALRRPLVREGPRVGHARVTSPAAWSACGQ